MSQDRALPFEKDDSRLRVLYLYRMLRDHTDESHTMSTGEIQERMSAEHGITMHRTTLSRDIEVLRAAGVEVISERKRSLRYYLADRPLSLPELRLLIDAVLSSKFITEKKSRELVEKLIALNGEADADKLRRTIHVTGKAKSDNEKGYYIVDAINEGINQGKRISFTYIDFDNRKKPVRRNAGAPYTVSPYDLIWDGDYETLTKSHEIIKRFEMQKLLSTLDLRIRYLYEQFGEVYDSSVTYRHQMYLRLLLCSVYYGPNTGAGYHISIDEAQDLAPTEFKMLKAVLGSKTVFNLYGDVNQAVYEYKGIDDWEDISDCIGNNVYVMNENYRNTLQITDYCNKVFGAEITAIGLNGEDVLTLPFSEAVKKILQIHDSSPEMRAAILFKRGVAQEERIKAQLPPGCSFDSVDPHRISVIPVDEAKGLEFDAVVVIDNDMNINEQYVSYTRALDNLIITKIPG